jgi:hypothetical protein
MKTLVAVLIIIHGLIVSSQAIGMFRPSAGVTNPGWLSWWPTKLGQSWVFSFLSSESNGLPAVAGVISLIAGVALIAAGLGLLNVIVPLTWWPLLAVIGAGASLLVLIIYLHPFYTIGLGANIALLFSILWVHWPEFMKFAEVTVQE